MEVIKKLLSSVWFWVAFAGGLLLLLTRRQWKDAGAVLTSIEVRKNVQEAVKAAKTRDDALEVIDKAHRRELELLNDSERKKAEELRENPIELSNYLVSVGTKVRARRGR